MNDLSSAYAAVRQGAPRDWRSTESIFTVACTCFGLTLIEFTNIDFEVLHDRCRSYAASVSKPNSTASSNSIDSLHGLSYAEQYDILFNDGIQSKKV